MARRKKQGRRDHNGVQVDHFPEAVNVSGPIVFR